MDNINSLNGINQLPNIGHRMILDYTNLRKLLLRWYFNRENSVVNG